VLLDGEPPGRSHGVDIDEDANGVLRDDRMYQLVRQHAAIRDRTLEISLPSARRRGVLVHVG
jgi:Thioredoxin like C-terminal domain